MLLKEQKYAWFLLLFLWFFGFVGSLGRFVTAFYQTDITASLGVGRDFIGFTWSTATIVGAICAPIGGYLVDRIGYKKVMLLVSLCNVLSLVIVVSIQNQLGYFVGNGLLAGIAGLGASTSYVLIANWFRNHRAKALAILGSAGSLGLAFLTPILNSISELNWIQVYKILLLPSILFIPFVFVFIKRNHDETEDKVTSSPSSLMKGSLLDYFRHPTLFVVVMAILTCGISMGTVEMNLVAIHQHNEVSTTMISSALSLLGLLEVFGGITFSFMLDRTSRTKALALLYLLRTVAFTFLITQFPVSPIMFSLLFGASYVGAVQGGILVAGETLGTGKRKIGLQTGFLLLIHQLGGAIAAICAGLNFDYAHNYQAIIILNLVLSLIVTMGYFIVSRKQVVNYSSEAA
ncbi:MFS transporter [Cohnella sp. WQ 127256]|uniref:MFS transporter n=1 Tax=Cohnella sp. WQ 127256 TaxID=2938790 RepID=UPI0021180457|nr:MFS transporter [Cohnella sp. WQ 127256]